MQNDSSMKIPEIFNGPESRTIKAADVLRETRSPDERLEGQSDSAPAPAYIFPFLTSRVLRIWYWEAASLYVR